MIGDEADAAFRAVRDEGDAAGEDGHDDVIDRIGRAEDADGEQRAADGADDGVDGVPQRIDPRDFIRKKLQEKKRAGDEEYGGMGEEVERLILRSERDPVLLDGEAGGKHGEVEIQAGERGQTEGDAQKLKLFHGANVRAAAAFTSGNSMRPRGSLRSPDS